jgi:hypothetical protein
MRCRKTWLKEYPNQTYSIYDKWPLVTSNTRLKQLAKILQKITDKPLMYKLYFLELGVKNIGLVSLILMGCGIS